MALATGSGPRLTLTVDEFAAILGVSKNSVYREVTEHDAVADVPAIRVRGAIVFSRRLVERLLDGTPPLAALPADPPTPIADLAPAGKALPVGAQRSKNSRSA